MIFNFLLTLVSKNSKGKKNSDRICWNITMQSQLVFSVLLVLCVLLCQCEAAISGQQGAFSSNRDVLQASIETLVLAGAFAGGIFLWQEGQEEEAPLVA